MNKHHFVLLIGLSLLAPFAKAQLVEFAAKAIVQEKAKSAVDKKLKKKSSDSENESETKTDKGKPAVTNDIGDLYRKAIERNVVLGLSVGPAYTSVYSPSTQFDARTGLFANFHWDRQSRFLFLIPMPWFASGLNLNYSTFNGTAEYHYKGDQGVNFVGVYPYRAYNISYGPFLRFRPLAGFPIQPFAEVGLEIGTTIFQFAGSATAPLDAQGSGAPRRETFFAFGYSASAGIEWDFAGIFGCSLSYRHADTRTNNSKLLGNHLAFKTDVVVSSLYLRY